MNLASLGELLADPMMTFLDLSRFRSGRVLMLGFSNSVDARPVRDHRGTPRV